MTERHTRAGWVAAAIVGSPSLFGCSQSAAVDVLVSSAYRPPKHESTVVQPVEKHGRFEVLAGDMHCHVSPPDDRGDVSRDLDETLKLARSEGLDFVVLTPHVWSRFFSDPALRLAVSKGQARLRSDIARLSPPDVVFIPGFEYTDHRYGHVGASFADVDSVLADLPLAEAEAHPEHFFEKWIAKGGMLVINHPLVTPIDSIFSMARADLSWRPLTARGPFPPEIVTINRIAQGYEVFNLTATELRDRWLLNAPDATLDATFNVLDAQIPINLRRMTPVGGSDSHSDHLRATTFVLSEAKTANAIRDALFAGRTCVRDPAACSFEIRAPGGDWSVVGSAIREGGGIDVRAHGQSIQVLVDGQVVASPDSDEVTRIQVPKDHCSVVRARVDEGYSGPIYVHCGDLLN